MAKDINKKPFDEATQTKLQIFEQYFIDWLPVFIKSRSKNVMICDFFAGSGQDSEGVAGSPLLILKTIDSFKELILESQTHIQVVLNEFDRGKCDELKSRIESKFDPHSWRGKIDVLCKDEDFQDLFPRLYPQLEKQPNLIFIDQYGIKHVTGDTFQKLISLERTDFFFFLSSSSIKRFCERPEFKEYLPGIDSEIIAQSKQIDMHRVMLQYYKDEIPPKNKTKLYPFTIKKGHNIYGLIFGSEHLLGVDKFLHIAWKVSELNGQANFDIDDDVIKERDKEQMLLFDEMKHKQTKRDIFEADLKKFILDKDGVTNRDVYLFTLEQGFLSSHAKEYINHFKKDGIVDYPGKIGFSYDSCINKPPKMITVKTHG